MARGEGGEVYQLVNGEPVRFFAGWHPVME